MKEFIDKLIERLEEVHEMHDKSKKSAYEEEDWEKFDLLSGRNQGINIAISIVNELAEEYKAVGFLAMRDCQKKMGNILFIITSGVMEIIFPSLMKQKYAYCVTETMIGFSLLMEMQKQKKTYTVK